MKNLDIMILSWNTLRVTANCIRHIKENTVVPYRLWVIDNNSDDGSKEYLQQYARFSDINLILNDENKMFTQAYIDAFKELKEPEYVMILNSDIMAMPKWDSGLDAVISKYPKAGVLAPRLLGADGRTVVGPCGMPDFCSHKTQPPTSISDELWVTFASVILNWNVYQSVGGFDPQFKFYCSDSDLCVRMHEAGHQVLYLPQSNMIHLHMASTRELALRNPKQYEKCFDDQKLFNEKWKGKYQIKAGVSV